MPPKFFTRLSTWMFGGNGHGPESAKLPSTKRNGMRPRRTKRKLRSREDRKIEKEFDFVQVPSDGVSMSGSESDAASDWSVGWLEPHAPGFQSHDENQNSFAVIVPCYARRQDDDGLDKKFGGIDVSDDINKHVDELLSSFRETCALLKTHNESRSTTK